MEHKKLFIFICLVLMLSAAIYVFTKRTISPEIAGKRLHNYNAIIFNEFSDKDVVVDPDLSSNQYVRSLAALAAVPSLYSKSYLGRITYDPSFKVKISSSIVKWQEVSNTYDELLTQDKGSLIQGYDYNSSLELYSPSGSNDIKTQADAMFFHKSLSLYILENLYSEGQFYETPEKNKVTNISMAYGLQTIYTYWQTLENNKDNETTIVTLEEQELVELAQEINSYLEKNWDDEKSIYIIDSSEYDLEDLGYLILGHRALTELLTKGEESKKATEAKIRAERILEAALVNNETLNSFGVVSSIDFTSEGAKAKDNYINISKMLTFTHALIKWQEEDSKWTSSNTIQKDLVPTVFNSLINENLTDENLILVKSLDFDNGNIISNNKGSQIPEFIFTANEARDWVFTLPQEKQLKFAKIVNENYLFFEENMFLTGSEASKLLKNIKRD